MLFLVASLLATPMWFQEDGFTKVNAKDNPNFAELLKGKGFVLGDNKNVRKNLLPKPVVEGTGELISKDEHADMASAQKAKLNGDEGAFVLGEPVKPVQNENGPQIVDKTWAQIRKESGLD